MAIRLHLLEAGGNMMKSSGALTSASAAAVSMSGLHMHASTVDEALCWHHYLSGDIVSLIAKGDGACSIHGMFGKLDVA